MKDKEQSILLVDDERDHSETMAEMLEKAGYHATVATNVPEAFGMLSKEPFDLIIVM